MLTFLTSFTLLIVISSFFIVSFYHLSRHWTELTPSNEYVTKGDTFLKYWSIFFEKAVDTKQTYYKERALELKYESLLYLQPKIAHKLELSAEKLSLIIKEPLTQDDILKMEAVLSCKVSGNDIAKFLYIEEIIYKFPYWVRKPLSSCPKCMATPFGTIIYFSVYHNFNNFLMKLFFYTIFVVVLSFVNRILYKETLKYV